MSNGSTSQTDAKLYIPGSIKTQIDLVPFCLADWAVRACTENFCNFAKVSYFWVNFFSYFQGQKKYKIRVSVNYGYNQGDCRDETLRAY